MLNKTARAEIPPIEKETGTLAKTEQNVPESTVQESQMETPAVSSTPEKISDPPKSKARLNQVRPERVALVKRGDTLYSIILRTYGDYSSQILGIVLEQNPEIRNPDKIFAGQKIELPREGLGN